MHTNTDTCARQARTDFYDEEDENMYYAMMARHDVVLHHFTCFTSTKVTGTKVLL
jgi:hypothetical protein